jgi:predicted DNA-binding antitoxin AbrB/MazE fold protein
MSTVINATFRNGVFVPSEPCDLPEETKVQVQVTGSLIHPPTVTDSEERRRLLGELVERMKKNPIGEGAPRFTRDELHERR